MKCLTIARAAFTGAGSDGDRTDDARTGEGYIEIIELAEVIGGTPAAFTPTPGTAITCGLAGSEAIVDVAQSIWFRVAHRAQLRRADNPGRDDDALRQVTVRRAPRRSTTCSRARCALPTTRGTS